LGRHRSEEKNGEIRKGERKRSEAQERRFLRGHFWKWEQEKEVT
jgi:hypothetical protein